jgi:hypothetical protein
MCPAVSSLKFLRPLGYKRPSSEKHKCDLDNKRIAKVNSRIEQMFLIRNPVPSELMN